MYQIKCGLKPQNGIPIICDTVEDFFKFDKLFQSRDVPKMGKNPFMRAYIKEIEVELAYLDEYSSGYAEWYYVNNLKYLNYLEPLAWHPLDKYRQ